MWWNDQIPLANISHKRGYFTWKMIVSKANKFQYFDLLENICLLAFSGHSEQREVCIHRNIQLHFVMLLHYSIPLFKNNSNRDKLNERHEISKLKERQNTIFSCVRINVFLFERGIESWHVGIVAGIASVKCSYTSLLTPTHSNLLTHPCLKLVCSLLLSSIQILK